MGAFVAVACLCLGGYFPSRMPAVDTLLVEESSLSFQKACRMTVTPSGSLFVCDEEMNKVYFFANPGSKPRVVGGFGWGETTFDKPSGVATDGVNIYVADYGNHRIQRYDRVLNFVSTLSTRDTSEERARFGFPLGVGLSRHGDLFVLDGENSRVVKFTNQSKFERTFGDVESAYRLQKPLSLVVTEGDHVLILERDQIVEFDFSGNYVRSIGKGTLADAQGFTRASDGFLVVESGSILWLDANGALRNRTRAEEMLLQKNVGRFCDVGVLGTRLFLLSEHSLRVFTIVTPQ